VYGAARDLQLGGTPVKGVEDIIYNSKKKKEERENLWSFLSAVFRTRAFLASEGIALKSR